MAEAGANLLPIDHRHRGQTSPIFNYPYARTRESLDRLSRFRPINEWHGHKMRYVNPLTGGWAMPTLATCMQLLPKGFETRPYRSTDSTVFVAVEGRGHSIVAGQRFDWEPHDIFVVPSWSHVTHHAGEESTLFSYSDRAVQEKLDLLREEALGTTDISPSRVGWHTKPAGLLTTSRSSSSWRMLRSEISFPSIRTAVRT